MKKPDPLLVTRSADRFAALGAEPRLAILRLLLSAHPTGMIAEKCKWSRRFQGPRFRITWKNETRRIDQCEARRNAFTDTLAGIRTQDVPPHLCWRKFLAQARRFFFFAG